MGSERLGLRARQDCGARAGGRESSWMMNLRGGRGSARFSLQLYCFRPVRFVLGDLVIVYQFLAGMTVHDSNGR